MKVIFLLSVLLLCFFIVSCGVIFIEGGPPGPEGPQGEDGDKGQDAPDASLPQRAQFSQMDFPVFK